MKHPQWSEIFYLYKEVEQQKSNLLEKRISADTVATARQSMIVSLNQLRNNLRQTLDEHCVHLIFFGIIALLDEEMNHLLIDNKEVEWATLQKHYFNITNSGEVFFENLDEALEKADLPSIVFESAYFILKRGFRGKYENSPNRIAKYMDFISEHIPSTYIEKKEREKTMIYPLIKPKVKIWHFYAAAMLLILGAYIGLNIHSNL